MGASFIPDIVGGVVRLATDWLGHHNRVKEAEVNSKIKLIESKARIEEARACAYTKLAQSDSDNTSAWERIVAEQAGNSWKDEWWTILLSIPIIGSFIPGLQPFIAQGFANIAGAPPWYLAATASAVAFAFGIRLVNPLLKKPSLIQASPLAPLPPTS